MPSPRSRHDAVVLNERDPKRSPDDASASPFAAIRGAALAILGQGELLLDSVTDEVYRKPLAVAGDASIGGHYRHCLDHFTNLLKAADRDGVDYDRRDRDPAIETDRRAARVHTAAIHRDLATFPAALLDRPIRSRCQVSYGAEGAPETGSTLARELVYVVAHAIHHYALIKILARTEGVELPAHFGVAPSTIAHRETLARGAARTA